MQKIFPLIATIVIITIISTIIMLIIAILGIVAYSGCYYRYSDATGTIINSTSMQLQANGRYDGISCAAGNSNCPAINYGQWVKVPLIIKTGANINLSINGEVSLCQGYTADSSKTPIPRVAGALSALPIILPAQSSTIKIANVYNSDKVQISVGLNSHSPSQTVYDITTKNNRIANCSDGATTYDPICGKYSFYSGFTYYQPRDCNIKKSCDCGRSTSTRDKECSGYNMMGDSFQDGGCECNLGVCLYNTHCNYCYRILTPSAVYSPQYYDTQLIRKSGCVSNSQITSVNSHYKPTSLVGNSCPADVGIANLKTWFSFGNGYGDNTVSGLSYDSSSVIQSKGCAINLLAPDSQNPPPTNQAFIFNGNAPTAGPVVYKFFDPQGSGSYVGGYVLYIKQTKCYRYNGSFQSDQADPDNAGWLNRGQIQALLLLGNQDPNAQTWLADNAMNLEFNTSNGQITNQISADKAGYLWLKINNSPADYPNSAGQYNVYVEQGSQGPHSTGTNVWNWITDLFLSKWQDAAKMMFKNMTCYGSGGQDLSAQTSCTNFFDIIKACLIAYLMIFGGLFALGALQINNVDLVVRILKVIVVAGLMNDNTFNFFSQYVFDLVFNSTAQIMASTLPASSDATLESTLSDFFTSIYSVMFSDIFSIQLLALLGTGLSGILFFILIILSLLLFLIPVFEFIVIYVGSSLMLAILISLAPIFLIFMLFDITRYLFENWIRFTIRYIFEPAIMFLGISLLTRLFLIYLDYVLGFSVCWKCNMPFQIPFLDQIFPFLANLKTVPIFCIYWLSPWGYDPMSYNFASSLSNIVGLFIISFVTLRYASLSSSICDSIFGQAAPTSLTSMASEIVKTAAISGLESLKKSANPDNNSHMHNSDSKGSHNDLASKRQHNSSMDQHSKNDVNNKHQDLQSISSNKPKTILKDNNHS